MPGKITRIRSTRLKKSVKAAIKLADKAIADGKFAVAASVKQARKTPKKVGAILKNERTLAKAKAIRAGLAACEGVANDCCPLQILILEFKYV